MTWFSAVPAPPRTDELLVAVRDRLLASADLDAALCGASRVVTVTEPHADPLGDENEVWGRAVVLFARTAGASAAANPARLRNPRVMVRVDLHSPGGGHDPQHEIGAAHAAVFAQLEGWRPTLAHASVATPFYQTQPADDGPLWDEQRGLWFASALYRILLAPTS